MCLQTITRRPSDRTSRLNLCHNPRRVRSPALVRLEFQLYLPAYPAPIVEIPVVSLEAPADESPSRPPTIPPARIAPTAVSAHAIP